MLSVDSGVSLSESRLVACRVSLHGSRQCSAIVPTLATGRVSVPKFGCGRSADRAFPPIFSCGRSRDRVTTSDPTARRVFRFCTLAFQGRRVLVGFGKPSYCQTQMQSGTSDNHLQQVRITRLSNDPTGACELRMLPKYVCRTHAC